MASQVSFADAIGSLKSMFPKFDDAVLRTMLEANGMHMERTIEQLLQMDSTMGDEGGTGGGSDNNSAAQATTTSSSHRTANLLDDDSPRDLPVAAASYDTSFRNGGENVPSLSIPTDSDGGGKQSDKAPVVGFKVNLPEDFLRPPGWREHNMTLGDEQLAMMLQNEMFAREVEQAMGPGFLSGFRRSPAQQQQQGPTDHIPASTSTGTGIPNLGIMSGLSSMSAAAKRNLSAIAKKFQSSNSTQEGVSPRSSESRSLLHKHDDDDDDEEEVVHFGGSRSHALDDSYDPSKDNDGTEMTRRL
jgi:hypothetical protein